MQGRNYQTSSNFRFGFNGKENDNEVKGNGNSQDYGLRIYDPRLGKFLSVDPLISKFPYYSPFHFAGNSPILNVDLDGAEDISHVYKQEGNGYTHIGVTDYRGTKDGAGSLGHGLQVIFINNKGDIRKEFYSSLEFSTKRTSLSESISRVLDKHSAGVKSLFPKGNIKNSWSREGKEHSPILKGELGFKGSLRVGPVKGQFKAYINDEGNERGVDYIQQATLSSNLSSSNKDFGISATPIYLNMTLNNDAGKASESEAKININIPINGAFGLQISLNSKGVSNIEVNISTSKLGIEIDGNGDLGKDKGPIRNNPVETTPIKN